MVHISPQDLETIKIGEKMSVSNIYTIFIMKPVEVQMAVVANCSKDIIPVCNLGERRAWQMRKRMEVQSIDR